MSWHRGRISLVSGGVEPDLWRSESWQTCFPLHRGELCWLQENGMAFGMCASPSALMAVSMMDSHLSSHENPQAQVGGVNISQASTGQTAL